MSAMPTPILENLVYAAPSPLVPDLCLDSAVPANRTVPYCAEDYDGPTAQADVKRKSTSPGCMHADEMRRRPDRHELQ